MKMGPADTKVLSDNQVSKLKLAEEANNMLIGTG